MSENNYILYKDDFCAIVQKRAGEICENSLQASDSLLCKNLKQQIEFADYDFIACANRLDRPVTGAVLVVFSKKDFTVFSNLFYNHAVEKHYIAVVEGVSTAQTDFTELDNEICFNPKIQKAFIKTPDSKNTLKWKKARLAYRCFGAGQNYSYFLIKPFTGRTHQIRSQLAHYGFHIKGDVKYGSRRSDPLGGIRLHSYKLAFQHPFTKKQITITAPMGQQDPLWQACFDCYDDR